MGMKYQDVPFTSAADGSATIYSGVLDGRIHRIDYIKTDADNGVTAAITTETTGQAVLTCGAGTINASAVFHPRTVTNKNTDAAALTVFDVSMYAMMERIKIVVAAAGNAKKGVFRIFTE